MGHSSGHKNDTGKLRLELLPFDALEEVAKVLGHGAAKYGERNWEGGLAYGRVFGALLRHAWAWWRGQRCDPETGLGHMAHCAANALFLLGYELRKRRDLDNRPRGLFPGRKTDSVKQRGARQRKKN